MRAGYYDITTDALGDLLSFPADARIADVRMDSRRDGIIRIRVESPYINHVIVGQEIPRVTIEEIGGWDG